MKKPEITKGEWTYDDNGSYFEIGIRNDHPLVRIKPTIVTTWPSGFKTQRKANAKAISAVPEMIDALIEAYGELARLQTKDCKEFDKSVIQIEKALIKAGVQL